MFEAARRTKQSDIPEPEQTLKSVFSRNKTLPLEREEKNKVLENQILLLIKTLLDELILFRVPICLSYIYIYIIFVNSGQSA